MADPKQEKLFSPLHDLQAAQWLLGELHDDLPGRVARFHQLNDLSANMGSRGTMIPGGEAAFTAWQEARSSFVAGNYIATVMLCQGLAEHVLAASLAARLDAPEISPWVKFERTLKLAVERNTIDDELAADLRKLMDLRNPLSHYKPIDNPENISMRAVSSRITGHALLLQDATFAIGAAVRMLSLPAFRLGA